MKTKRRGFAAVEMTVAGAALTFLVSTVFPTLDAVREDFKAVPGRSVPYKQIGLAVLNYEGSAEPLFDELAAVLSEDEPIGRDRLSRLNEELRVLADQYRQGQASIQRVMSESEDREEIIKLREVEASVNEMISTIATMQRFLDVLALPQSVIDDYPDREELIELILSER